MAEPMTATHPLQGQGFGNGVVSIAPVAGFSRLSLRAAAEDRAGLGDKLGVDLPGKPRGVSRSGARTSFWIGPDEWLVLDGAGGDLMGEAAKAGVVASAVDISHRNVAFTVSGKGAADTLNCACPLDLSEKAFPTGSATRTVFGKAEIVLWRRAADEWHVECWRSFAPYVFAMLEEGARDAALT